MSSVLDYSVTRHLLISNKKIRNELIYGKVQAHDDGFVYDKRGKRLCRFDIDAHSVMQFTPANTDQPEWIVPGNFLSDCAKLADEFSAAKEAANRRHARYLQCLASCFELRKPGADALRLFIPKTNSIIAGLKFWNPRTKFFRLQISKGGVCSGAQYSTSADEEDPQFDIAIDSPEHKLANFERTVIFSDALCSDSQLEDLRVVLNCTHDVWPENLRETALGAMMQFVAERRIKSLGVSFESVDEIVTVNIDNRYKFVFQADANTNEILAGKGTNWKKIGGPLMAEQIREIAL